jgi:hypothetical protein
MKSRKFKSSKPMSEAKSEEGMMSKKETEEGGGFEFEEDLEK